MVTILERSLPLIVERPFYVNQWATHNSLVLRSPNMGPAEQIDVMFRPVSALKLPQSLPFLHVRKPDSSDLETISLDFPGINVAEGFRAFMLQGPGFLGYVVANNLLLAMGSLDGSEWSPLLHDVSKTRTSSPQGPFYRFE